MQICRKDRELLRAYAQEQMEIANSLQMKNLEKLWKCHNDLHGERPMVTIETGSFAQEVIDPLMKCEGEEARALERVLLANIVNTKYFHDDTFVNDFYSVNYRNKFVPLGIQIDRTHAGGLGHHFVSQISDLEDDFDKLQESLFEIESKESAQKRADDISEIFGDILPTKVVGAGMYSVPTQDIVHFMDMEDMYISMMDYPDLYKKMMDMLSDDYVKYYKEMEKRGVYLPTTYSERLGQGTYCFTDDLPSEVNSTKDLWLFMDSQETTGISPKTYEELIFPYYKKISDNFGLLSYGCCEAVDPIWENCLSKLDNLRKVSISPWCNEEYMGEALKGRKTIYHRKPSPNFIGIEKVLDEDAFRKHIAKTVNASKGCTVEFTQRDVYTVHNDFDKVKRYIEIIREEYSK